MDRPVGAGAQLGNHMDLDPRVRLESRGTQVSSGGGLLVMREPDHALGLSGIASGAMSDSRRGRNTTHPLDNQFRQAAIFS